MTVTYTRVSSHDQKDDLVRQTEELKKYCEEQRFANVQAIEDLGSGINYKKKGLQKLIRDVMMGKVNRIVFTYKDRLVRFGIEILEQVCRLKMETCTQRRAGNHRSLLGKHLCKLDTSNF